MILLPCAPVPALGGHAVLKWTFKESICVDKGLLIDHAQNETAAWNLPVLRSKIVR